MIYAIFLWLVGLGFYSVLSLLYFEKDREHYEY